MIIEKIKLDLSNYKNVYGGLNLFKIEAKLSFLCSKYKVYRYDKSLKELCYMFLDSATYKKLLKDLDYDLSHNIERKGFYIINNYNDAKLYKIDSYDKTVYRLTNTKNKLDQIIKNIYLDYKFEGMG